MGHGSIERIVNELIMSWRKRPWSSIESNSLYLTHNLISDH